MIRALIKEIFMIEFISTEKFKTDVFDFTAHDTWSYQKDRPVIVNFTASWCGPCRMFSPILEKIAEDYHDKLDILKIDIDQFPEVPAVFGVMSVPTTLFISKGQDPTLASGVIQREDMDRAIEEILGIPRV